MITKKFRFLTLALIFSGALNIGLIAAFAFFMYQDTPVAVARAGKNQVSVSNGQIFASMSRLTFRELVSYLTNRDLVEEGYAKRDLALAVLSAYRHLDVEKALAGSLHQRRVCSLDAEHFVEMYPGLTDEQFKAIIQFVYLEKWPLTPEGLFKLVQKNRRVIIYI